MGNADTVKAITTNLTAILTAQGFLVENSSTDKKLETSPLVAIRYGGENFESTHGERPSYSTARYSLRVSFSDKYPSTSRDKAVEWAHKIRGNVTVNALNAGDLAASKLVSRVDHDYDAPVYDAGATSFDYSLDIRYRES